jgi:hypothetical protein
MITALMVIAGGLSFILIMILGLFWNAEKNYTVHEVSIKCPECAQIQKAKVLEGFPWNIYVHHCEFCEYIIMESEWEEVA